MEYYSWSRAELKGRAKDAIRKNYWVCVLAAVVIGIVTASGGGNAGKSAAAKTAGNYLHDSEVYFDGAERSLENRVFSLPTLLFGLVGMGLALAFGVAVLAAGILLGNVLEVGCKGVFLENSYGRPSAGQILSAFRSNTYWNVVKIMFFRNLFLALWTMLLIVPGLIKAYEYYMVPYLLAEHPEMPMSEVFARSREMMRDEKWNAFVLELSFLPWFLLSGITMNLVGIFFVNPYLEATRAELYHTLRYKVEGYRSY